LLVSFPRYSHILVEIRKFSYYFCTFTWG